jgi:hypothetical protein
MKTHTCLVILFGVLLIVAGCPTDSSDGEEPADDDSSGDDDAGDDDGSDDDGADDDGSDDDAGDDDGADDDSGDDDAGDDDTSAGTWCDGNCDSVDVVLCEPLLGNSGGIVQGGSFGADGWTTGSTTDQIFWDLGQGVDSGSVSFEARGFHHLVNGCVWGVCYFVGLFEEANGDKQADYTGSAFIESRYHNDEQENFHDTFKLQTGTGDGSMQEPMMQQGIGWAASEWHSYRIEWGGGQSRLYIDGNHELTANYSPATGIDWRYLFLGTTNYKGIGWAATGITYRQLCLRSL